MESLVNKIYVINVLCAIWELESVKNMSFLKMLLINSYVLFEFTVLISNWLGAVLLIRNVETDDKSCYW
jgi:hypothetical protein